MPLVLNGATSGSTTINPTDAVTVVLTAPATSGTLAVSGGAPSFATLTVTGDASISGLTVGKGGGGVGSNSAFGPGALSANTTGAAIVAVGYQAFATNTTGANSTAVGYQALVNNTTASNNTAVGYQAGYSTTGATNTFLGYTAGSTLTTGVGNLYIGAYTRPSNAAVDYEMLISTASSTARTGKGTNTGYIDPDGGGVYQGNNSSTWSVTSDRRLKKNIVDNNTGLDLINQIQVRNFEYRLPEEVAELEPTCAVERTGVQLGVIAQEIQKVSQEFVKEESTGVLSVDSDNLTWYLINAVKELNAKVTALEAQLGAK